MRIVFRVLIVLLTFLLGLGAVLAAEAVIEKLTVVEVEPILLDRTSYFDRAAAILALATPIDFHVKGIRLGSTEREVIKAIGRPLGVERLQEHPDLFVYRYDGLELRLYEYEGSRTVDSIEILGPSISIEGLTVGSTLEEVRTRLGPEQHGESGGLYYFNEVSDNARVTIIHDGARVISISAAFAGC